jgi:hypothetical protein
VGHFERLGRETNFHKIVSIFLNTPDARDDAASSNLSSVNQNARATKIDSQNWVSSPQRYLTDWNPFSSLRLSSKMEKETAKEKVIRVLVICSQKENYFEIFQQRSERCAASGLLLLVEQAPWCDVEIASHPNNIVVSLRPNRNPFPGMEELSRW